MNRIDPKTSALPVGWQSYKLGEMADIVKAKADDQGRFTPESIWMAWKGWGFGQKREPSQWLTFLILRIFKRFEI